MEPGPDEVPTEADATLIGTWSWEGAVPGGTRDVETLTFTASRFIYHLAQYDETGTGRFSLVTSGTYRVESNTQVVRIWKAYDGDDNSYLAELPKSCELRGDSLLVNPWGDTRKTSFVREYRRVAMPRPDLAGTWHVTIDFTNQDLTVVLSPNGDFAMRQRSFDPNSIDYHVTGTWDNDLDNLFVRFTVRGGAPENYLIGQTLVFRVCTDGR